MNQIIDTNVFILADAPEDTHRSHEDILKVIDWLHAFGQDKDRQLTLDNSFLVYEEYMANISTTGFAYAVLIEKMRTATIYDVAYDPDGYAVVPDTLASIDNSDKKFIALSLAEDPHICIINACDSDWAERRELLEAHHIHVVELLHEP